MLSFLTPTPSLRVFDINLISLTTLFFLNPTPFVERLIPKMNKDKDSNGSEVTICVNTNLKQKKTIRSCV